MDILTALHVDHLIHGFNQEIDAVLSAHDADVTDQMLAAVLQVQVRGNAFEARQIRHRAHDINPLRAHAAALNRDVFESLVGRNRHVRGFEGQPFEPQKELMEATLLAKLGFVEFRIDVVVVKDEALAKQIFPKPADQEQQVRRIARLHNIKTDFEIGFNGQCEFPRQRPRILKRITKCAVGLNGQRVTEDVNAFENFIGRGVLATFGANHRDRVSGVLQRAGFLPDPAIEGNC